VVELRRAFGEEVSAAETEALIRNALDDLFQGSVVVGGQGA
jgi:hypothetical protein